MKVYKTTFLLAYELEEMDRISQSQVVDVSEIKKRLNYSAMNNKWG